MKRNMAILLLIGFLVCMNLPAMAQSFSGMVINVSIYGITVQKDNTIKVFQIRPQTTGDRQPHPEDIVVVDYRMENGVMVATHVKIIKRFVP